MSNLEEPAREAYKNGKHKCPKCGAAECEYVDDDYGSLADGGSYEIHKCSACGNRAYVPMPD